MEANNTASDECTLTATIVICPKRLDLLQNVRLPNPSTDALRVPMVMGLKLLHLERMKPRYQRMRLSKITRTSHLFPEESRPANDDFSGFGGVSYTSTSRRDPGISVALAPLSSNSVISTLSIASSFMPSGEPSTNYINKPPAFALNEDEKLRKANPLLMVVSHPELEKWHNDSIRNAVGEYGIVVIFVPLYEDEDEELPVLKPLDPKTMTNFASLGSLGTAHKAAGATQEEEIVLKVDVEAKFEDLIEHIVGGVRDIMDAQTGDAAEF